MSSKGKEKTGKKQAGEETKEQKALAIAPEDKLTKLDRHFRLTEEIRFLKAQKTNEEADWKAKWEEVKASFNKKISDAENALRSVTVEINLMNGDATPDPTIKETEAHGNEVATGEGREKALIQKAPKGKGGEKDAQGATPDSKPKKEPRVAAS